MKSSFIDEVEASFGFVDRAATEGLIRDDKQRRHFEIVMLCRKPRARRVERGRAGGRGGVDVALGSARGSARLARQRDVAWPRGSGTSAPHSLRLPTQS